MGILKRSKVDKIYLANLDNLKKSQLLIMISIGEL